MLALPTNARFVRKLLKIRHVQSGTPDFIISQGY
jgi:hypothetical protein